MPNPIITGKMAYHDLAFFHGVLIREDEKELCLANRHGVIYVKKAGIESIGPRCICGKLVSEHVASHCNKCGYTHQQCRPEVWHELHGARWLHGTRPGDSVVDLEASDANHPERPHYGNVGNTINPNTGCYDGF